MTETNNTEAKLIITRTFNAPRELVFKMWASAEHMANWWGPKGIDMIVHKLDFKPGGEFHYVMKGNGFDMWGKFIYHEIVEPEKIVFVNSFSDEAGNTTHSPFHPVWPMEILNTLTLEEEDGKTTLTIAGGPINATDEEIQAFRDAKAGMQQGFGGTFDKLAGYLSDVQSV